MMFDSVPSMAPMIQAGRVKALGTTGKMRSAILPDVPTLSEAGVPGYEATIWIGVMAPAGTPQPIVTLLNTEINKILARADVVEAWTKQGATAMSMTPEQFGDYVQSEIDKWARVITADVRPTRAGTRRFFGHGFLRRARLRHLVPRPGGIWPLHEDPRQQRADHLWRRRLLRGHELYPEAARRSPASRLRDFLRRLARRFVRAAPPEDGRPACARCHGVDG